MFYSEFSHTTFSSPSVCKYFAKGTCYRGNHCPFAHEYEETTVIIEETIDFQEEDVGVCKFFLQGRCNRGNKCKFSHGPQTPITIRTPQTTPQKTPQNVAVPKSPLPTNQNFLQIESQMSTPSLLEVIENERKSPYRMKVGLEHFDILAQIGDGYVGRVFQVRMKKNSNIYAMKVIPKQTVLESSLVFSVLTERNIMMGLDHPFIIKLHYAFQTSGSLHLIMDFLPGGDLSFHLNNLYCFSESLSRFYAAEIILALQYLHNQNIIYRDLKAANTLLDMDGHIRLADFGMSKLLEGCGPERTTNSFCGTTRYMAPEVINNTNYGIPIDWWSFGILLFHMLTGQFPFDDDEEDTIPQKILNDRIDVPSNLSPVAKSLLHGLLDRNPKTRLKGVQITQHAFFSSVDWKKLYNKEIKPEWKPYLENPHTDLSNFPSDVTCTTPQNVTDTFSDVKYKFERFSYCSPTIESVLAQAMKDNGFVDDDYTLDWEGDDEEMEEDEMDGLEAEERGEGADEEDEEEDEMEDIIPEDGCFVLSI